VVSSNTIEDLDPCPERNCSYSAVEGVYAVMNDWCGGVYASGYGTLGGLVAWGGGHNGYFGSELYVFDLAAHAWVRHTEPYDNGGGSVADDCSDDGIYPDGSPCPTHTYNAIEYHPGTNRLVLLIGTPDPVMGGAYDGRAHLFSFTTNTWALGAHVTGSFGYDAPGVYDASRDLFWQLYGYVYQLDSYDPDLDQWTHHGSPGTWDIDGAGRVDPVRDLFLFIDSRGTGDLYAIRLAAPTEDMVELTVAGDTEIQSASAIGFDWDPMSESFVAWDEGADVYVLTPPSGDWQTETWLWTRVPPAAGNTVVPVRNPNGTYGRFRYVPAINAFILASEVDGPVWAYRLVSDACQDAGDCTAAPVCRTATDATCSGGLCVYPPANEGGACDDDQNPCTDDTCLGGTCTHNGQAGRACDDGDACTTPDACNAAGACVPGPNTCPTCTDGDGDGYGDPASAVCTHPERDCDDSDDAIHPGATEVCNGSDDNCDSTTDEGCACAPAASRPCYGGPAGTEGVGACHGGTQTCPSGTWGACDGQRLPETEVCDDSIDNDCDTLTDAADLADCDGAKGPRRGAITAGCSCGGGAAPDATPWLLVAAAALGATRRRCRDR
jgi:MYXO-CTERM domain-containing protein